MVRSYWIRIGMSYIEVAAFLAISSAIIQFFTSPWGNANNLILYVISPIFLAVGIIIMLIGYRSDAKLKKLKLIGKAFSPKKVTVVPKKLTIQNHAFENKDLYNSFYVECVIHGGTGRDILFKSHWLAVYKRYFIDPQPHNVECDAVVYVNSTNIRDFAIEVFVSK